MHKIYNDYSSYLKERYGCKVYRIGLDAGFTCPNRDGSKGTGGCLYCNGDGSRATYTNSGEPVGSQLDYRIRAIKRKKGASKFIAYFQAFTNTYAPVPILKEAYDAILPFEDIVGLSIGTRPDSIDPDKLDLISSYKDKYEVWIEYGLQSIHDRTLKSLNRGHSSEDFFEAVKMTKDRGIMICAHVILGLPGETKDDMLRTAAILSDLGVRGVKIHLFHILRGSLAEKIYSEGGIRLLEQDEYAGLVCDFLENLSPDIIIQRLTGEGRREDHIAPLWALDKFGTIEKIRENMEERGSCQGRLIS